MLIKLDSENHAHQKFSYQLQKERYEYDNTNIPHLTSSTIPTIEKHCEYIKVGRHLHYCIYMENYTYKGIIYLKNNSEICIFIAKKYIGNQCGEKCLGEFLELIKMCSNIKELTATVNKNNTPSNDLFKKLGFDHVGNLYGISL